MIHFSNFKFHSIMDLPVEYEIYDFTQGYEEHRVLKHPYGIGKYNEKRKNMYMGDLYKDHRDIHMGLDIGAPVGTPVFSFYAGEIFAKANHSQIGNYGYTLVTVHSFATVKLYALYGHLSKESFLSKKIGQKISSGETLGWVGSREDNGGWNPHVHFQLSYKKPSGCDMPGVVHERDLAEALKIYPDPRNILGPLY